MKERQREYSASLRNIEIVDTAGKARIILGTDSSGTAEVRFIAGDGKKVSYIRQYSEGSMSMRFAGHGDRASVVIDAFQSGPGPIVSLRGNAEDEMIYLGAANFQDDVPSELAYGWGLYVPAGGFKPSYAAIGAYRDQKTGKIQGFVQPER